MRPVAEPPEPDTEDWPDIVVRLYRSLATSGQADFYQDSDWAYAYIACQLLADGLNAPRLSGEKLNTLDGMMRNLMVTEVHRRNVRLELQNAPNEDQDATVRAINTARSQLGAG